MSNGPPDKVVELTKEEYEFLLDNCDSNIEFGLKALQATESRETAEKLVKLMESFKSIKQALRRAK